MPKKLRKLARSSQLLIKVDTDKKGHFLGVLRTNDYVEGCWISDNIIYPMYLIREGSEVTPPMKPSSDIMKFDGHWTGKNSGYFGGSEANIKVLFEDIIFFELSATNGSHMGDLSGFATIKNNIAASVFKDKTYDDQENVKYQFRVENNLLKLESNRYDYMCGAGVGFDSVFTKEKVDVSMPTALEVGILETKKQDQAFRKLVGSRYEEFIQYTQWVSYSDTMLDGEKVSAGTSMLRGLNGYCFYIISSKYIYAAVASEDFIEYYTNDKKYAKKLPLPMLEWANKKDLKGHFNYKE